MIEVPPFCWTKIGGAPNVSADIAGKRTVLAPLLFGRPASVSIESSLPKNLRARTFPQNVSQTTFPSAVTLNFLARMFEPLPSS